MGKTLFTAHSKSGSTIRLSEKTWQEKICNEHPEFREKEEYLGEVKKTIEEPDYIVKDWAGEFLAFFVSRYGKLLRRELIWRKD